ncbi:MAG: ATP-binding protein, partial [Actinomycetota bacterium]|nr:ATP-binding protein [Actinomycetota bacterium]
LQTVVPQLASIPAAVRGIQSAVESLDDTIRGTIFDLHQHDDDTTLRAQVRDAVLTAAATGGPLPSLVLDGPLDSVVPDQLRPHLVAVLVEALSNVARHADAEHIDVHVAIESEPVPTVVVEVGDDGRGFDAAEQESGLRNMRERAQVLNGTLEVTSTLGEGTTIRWQVPLNQELVN